MVARFIRNRNMNNNTDKKPENDQDGQFLKLLRLHEKKIYGCILSLVPNRVVAEDIMQETTVIMWRKFPDYQKGSNFSAWGVTIGRFLVMDYFRKESRSIIRFSSEAMKNISESTGVFDSHDERVEALRECLKKMPSEVRKILKLRYQHGKSIKAIANEIQKPIHGMYKQVSKMHFLLQRCIQRKLTTRRGNL